MDIQKRCQWCGKPFIAHKMTTLYCSTACIDKAYRAKKKQKLKEQVEDEQQVTLPIVESIGNKPFISPKEAAALLGVSIPTLYRYMVQGMFKALRTPAKTIIRWSDLEAWFDNAPAYVKRNNRKHKIDSDSYTLYKMSIFTSDFGEKYRYSNPNDPNNLGGIDKRLFRDHVSFREDFKRYGALKLAYV